MSFMSDIYSLGVIIKEMVTGSREEPNVDRVTRIDNLTCYHIYRCILVVPTTPNLCIELNCLNFLSLLLTCSWIGSCMLCPLKPCEI
jgi:hypothetical protein